MITQTYEPNSNMYDLNMFYDLDMFCDLDMLCDLDNNSLHNINHKVKTFMYVIYGREGVF